MATYGTVRSMRLRHMDDDDQQRCMVEAELIAQAKPPGHGPMEVSVSVAIWIHDDPTWEQIQLRVLEAVSQAFVLPAELRSRLGNAFVADQKTE